MCLKKTIWIDNKSNQLLVIQSAHNSNAIKILVLYIQKDIRRLSGSASKEILWCDKFINVVCSSKIGLSKHMHFFRDFPYAEFRFFL